jgi:hypothetical protein
LLVAIESQKDVNCQGTIGIPFRTFTWTLEYPFVTFLTLLMTFDIVAMRGGASGDYDERSSRKRSATSMSW